MNDSYRKGFLSICCFGLAALLLVASHIASAAVYSELDYISFERKAGRPDVETVTFSSVRPGTGFTLNVYNGGRDGHSPTGEHVSSATITLNGVQIFGPADFHLRHGAARQSGLLSFLRESVWSLFAMFAQILDLPNVDQQSSVLSTNVVLQAENTLEVLLRGRPGGVLAINIEGEDGDLPEITAAVSPAANESGWHNVAATVNFSCNDATSGIESCPAAVTVDAEGKDQIIEGEALDLAGNAATASVIVNLDFTSPGITASIMPAPTAAGFYDEPVTVSFECSDALSGIQTCPHPVTLMEEGPGQTVVGTAVDHAGNTQLAGATVDIVLTPPTPDLPPDPATIAPALDRTGTTNLKNATEFLYAGSNPIQTGLAPETIVAKRVAVLRGSVRGRDNNPLPGVSITIKDHPEFGQTLTRADGMFDMAVNGGGYLTLNYEKAGYLPAQRQVDAPWNDFVFPDDIVMIPVDEQVTSIDLSDSSQMMQVAQGSVQSDEDGSRQATIFFPRGTSATMTLPGGGVRALDQIHVRATEYTVGENGPETMPAVLPPTSGYTYAVELSVDEAIAAGATRVDFTQPLPVYVDNFLQFPVGMVVPSGWYDREKVAWISSDNGRVIEILAIVDDLAQLDVDGSGAAATSSALSELGITDAERRQLALTFEAGKSFWRVPVTHFTPWDYNWPYGPPKDAEPPEQPEPEPDEPEPEPECQGGSIIECQGAVLRERIPIVGTPFSLNYRSDQVPGRKAFVDIRLSGEAIPSSLQSIVLRVNIAGREFSYSFPAETDLTHRFIWDGKDAYGRHVVGSHAVNIRIGYVYEAVYYEPSEFGQAFARAGNGTIARGVGGVVLARRLLTIWQQTTQQSLQAEASARQEFGGWTISAQHRFDSLTNKLTLGTGTVENRRGLDQVITTIAGKGAGGSFEFEDGDPATSVRLSKPKGMVTGPDGSVYVADSGHHRIVRVSPEGTLHHVAGIGVEGFSGDGGLAKNAKLDTPVNLALGPDGSLYFTDFLNMRVRRIDTNGIITTVSGNGTHRFDGDGGLATETSIPSYGIVVGADDSLYTSASSRVLRISPTGVVTTIAGDGRFGFAGDGLQATDSILFGPAGLALSPDGFLYIADSQNNRIRRVGPDGVITTVAGNGSWGSRGDGDSAVEAELRNPLSVALDGYGNLYIADTYSHRIRKVSSTGTITTIAGIGEEGYYGDGGPALKAALFFSRGDKPFS